MTAFRDGSAPTIVGTDALDARLAKVALSKNCFGWSVGKRKTPRYEPRLLSTWHTIIFIAPCRRVETAAVFNTGVATPMNEAIELIRQLVFDHFYGALTLKFEAGRITTIKKEQTLKPSDLLPGQPGKRTDETKSQQ
jgi:hypothetical protein